MGNWRFTLVLLATIALGAGSAFAQTFNSGSTGADGAFNPTTNTTLTLPPDGVFNFTTINIPAGVTVTFTRNAANTPVTMLATGNVTIAGTVNINGSNGGPALLGATVVGTNGGAGGPGGFDGGTGATSLPPASAGSGLGPGGGGGGPYFPTPLPLSGGGGGGFATSGGSGAGGASPGSTYGAPTLLPLIAGSGGGGGGAFGNNNGAGGGGGGGAILIASSSSISLFGSITARGGLGGNDVPSISAVGAGGSGSGGAVRLVANTIGGNGGSISVAGGGSIGSGPANTHGGAGGAGRVRIEGFTNTATIAFSGAGASVGAPGPLALASGPCLRIASVAGVAAPAAPAGSFSVPDVVIPFGTPNPMTVALAASNIPLGTTVNVTVSGLTGGNNSAVSSPLAGTMATSTASASVTIPTDRASVISASATFTLASLPGAGPLFVRGEEVEQVRVAAVLGGQSTITYITKSGREVSADALLER